MLFHKPFQSLKSPIRTRTKPTENTARPRKKRDNQHPCEMFFEKHFPILHDEREGISFGEVCRAEQVVSFL